MSDISGTDIDAISGVLAAEAPPPDEGIPPVVAAEKAQTEAQEKAPDAEGGEVLEGAEGDEDPETPEEQVEDEEAVDEASQKNLDGIAFRNPDGTEVVIPVDAKVTVKVDGKEMELTLDQMRSKVSGAVSLERRNQKLGRQEQILAQATTGFKAEQGRFLNVLRAFGGILKHGSIEHLAEYVGAISNQDPNAVLGGWVQSVQQGIHDAHHLTPEQRRLKYEAGSLAVTQFLESEGERHRATEERIQAENEALAGELQAYGLSLDDTGEYLHEMLDEMRAGKLKFEDKEGRSRDPDPFDLIDFTLRKQASKRLEPHVKILNGQEKTTILDRLSRAVQAAEFQQERRLTDAEVKQLVAHALSKRVKQAGEELQGKATERATKGVAPKPKDDKQAKQAEDRLIKDLSFFGGFGE
jgi:hypothetical protein